MIKSILVAALLISLTACSNNQLGVKEAQQILENREKHSKDIQESMEGCLKNSNLNRDVKYNDSAEVVEECKKYAFKLYGVDSYWGLDYIMERANAEK